MTFRVPVCECSHVLGDHVHVRRPGQRALAGVCYVPGCDCRKFTARADTQPADEKRRAA